MLLQFIIESGKYWIITVHNKTGNIGSLQFIIKAGNIGSLQFIIESGKYWIIFFIITSGKYWVITVHKGKW